MVRVWSHHWYRSKPCLAAVTAAALCLFAAASASVEEEKYLNFFYVADDDDVARGSTNHSENHRGGNASSFLTEFQRRTKKEEVFGDDDDAEDYDDNFYYLFDDNATALDWSVDEEEDRIRKLNDARWQAQLAVSFGNNEQQQQQEKKQKSRVKRMKQNLKARHQANRQEFKSSWRDAKQSSATASQNTFGTGLGNGNATTTSNMQQLLQEQRRRHFKNNRQQLLMMQERRKQKRRRKNKKKNGRTAFDAGDNDRRPNLLFIMTDQQRYDAIGFIQDNMEQYKSQHKVRTPNLDRLAANGVWFRRAYCQAPQCAPSRATIRTGCTVERTGIQRNSLQREQTYAIMDQFLRKIEAMETYDQILVEERGYTAEHYGKWHMPKRWLYKRRSGKVPKEAIISNNDFDFEAHEPKLTLEKWLDVYQRRLFYLLKRAKIPSPRDTRFRAGQQENRYTKYPYDPIPLDPRFRTRTKSSLRRGKGSGLVFGKDTLPSEFSPTAVLGQMAIHSIERLSKAGKPWSLTLSFNSPHPPMVATKDWFKFYHTQRSEIKVPSSIGDPLENSPYHRDSKSKEGYADRVKVQQWTATYYALVTEVDEWIGKILNALDSMGQTKQTLIIFTSDHGEMLGAHSMQGKNNFYEEAVRVPLLMSFPGEIPKGKVVRHTPVSHLDLFSTILDYLNVPKRHDKSDGKSLRRYIEDTSANSRYDERFVVAETDNRSPSNRRSLGGRLGDQPNFMIVKGRYKLTLAKIAKRVPEISLSNKGGKRNRRKRRRRQYRSRYSDKKLRIRAAKDLDTLYDMGHDPDEMRNLLGTKGITANRKAIGKAEHLKILLIEWMQRKNGGDRQLYSNPKYNGGRGNGDINEIRSRQTWRSVGYWLSDRRLNFPKPVFRKGVWFQNEYVYLGRTKPGTLRLTNVAIRGRDAHFFKVSRAGGAVGTVRSGDYLRLKVTFRSRSRKTVRGLKAFVVMTIQTRHSGKSDGRRKREFSSRVLLLGEGP